MANKCQMTIKKKLEKGLGKKKMSKRVKNAVRISETSQKNAKKRSRCQEDENQTPKTC